MSSFYWRIQRRRHAPSCAFGYTGTRKHTPTFVLNIAPSNKHRAMHTHALKHKRTVSSPRTPTSTTHAHIHPLTPTSTHIHPLTPTSTHSRPPRGTHADTLTRTRNYHAPHVSLPHTPFPVKNSTMFHQTLSLKNK